MSSSIEMNNVCVDMSVTTLLLKTLENATREYARGCVTRCASLYGFDSNEALAALNLENLAIQVREMKKRSSGKKTKAEKTEKAEKPVKEKTVKVVKEKVVKETVVKPYKPSIPLPFVDSMVSDDGCQGLAFNGGLFTQCQKIRMSQGSYCKGCQTEAVFNANGAPNNGSVEQRLGCFMMDFRDSKGRAPIAYSKIMEKSKLTREQVELEAGKLNIVIDDVHFVVVEKKVEAGRPKAVKKTVTVVESATVEDLFAQLVDEESEDETATVLISSSEDEEEVDTRSLEKGERDMMKESDLESKKVEKAIKNAEKEAQRIAAKEQKIADELALKEAKKMQLEQLEEEKAQKKIDEQAAKEAKIAADLLAKEQKIAADLAAKAAKEQKLIDDKLAKEQKIAADLAAKEQKKIDEQLAKEAKIAADLLAKEQKIAADLAAKDAKKLQLEQEKAAKEQKLIDDKLAKEAKVAADLAAKEQKKIDELAAKEAKKLQLEQEKAVKDKKIANEKAAKEAKVAAELLAKEAKKVQQSKAEPKVAAVKAVEEPTAAAKTKVTVKRITIDGKQYLKTAENLLYDPETKEEMGIFDPATNTIKELPDDDEDEVQEDGYASE
jgi:hypothetical protein